MTRTLWTCIVGELLIALYLSVRFQVLVGILFLCFVVSIVCGGAVVSYLLQYGLDAEDFPTLKKLVRR